MFTELPAANFPHRRPFVASLAAHGVALVFVWTVPQFVLVESLAPMRQVIARNERTLIWYRFDRALPEISPPEAPKRPLTARRKSARQAVAFRPPQATPGERMAWVPEPKLVQTPDLEAPNLLAFNRPAPVPAPQPRPFAPPVPQPTAAPGVAEVTGAPELRAELAGQSPVATPVAKPRPRAFRVPTRRAEVPNVVDAGVAPALPSELTPPPLTARLRVAARPFETPRARERAPDGPVRLDAPELARQMAPGDVMIVPGTPAVAPRPAPRAFQPPAASGRTPTEAFTEVGGAPELSAAVIGLTPLDRAAPVIPDGNLAVELAAAPEASAEDSGAAAVESARLSLPGLAVGGGRAALARDPVVVRREPVRLARAALPNRESLVESTRPLFERPQAKSGARVASSPDPRFAGRVVYALAVQGPNVTSHSGSWMMWFADREGHALDSAELVAPVPVRKVDPAYSPAAIAENVEGFVRLAAVIRADGAVEEVTLVRGVDERLDRSAVAALSKWRFEPALRDGKPVSVEALVEVPFRLQP
ncbi:MAG: TonB family protein [Bryobacterales bacterium]|nr:TonB family protein [Bryobacterales bacterium]